MGVDCIIKWLCLCACVCVCACLCVFYIKFSIKCLGTTFVSGLESVWIFTEKEQSKWEIIGNQIIYVTILPYTKVAIEGIYVLGLVC